MKMTTNTPRAVVYPPYTLADLRRRLSKLQDQLTHGCGNNGCIIKHPSGMGTNANCRCQPYQIARDLRKMSEAVSQLGTSWPEPN